MGFHCFSRTLNGQKLIKIAEKKAKIKNFLRTNDNNSYLVSDKVKSIKKSLRVKPTQRRTKIIDVVRFKEVPLYNKNNIKHILHKNKCARLVMTTKNLCNFVSSSASACVSK